MHTGSYTKYAHRQNPFLPFLSRSYFGRWCRFSLPPDPAQTGRPREILAHRVRFKSRGSGYIGKTPWPRYLVAPTTAAGNHARYRVAISSRVVIHSRVTCPGWTAADCRRSVLRLQVVSGVVAAAAAVLVVVVVVDVLVDFEKKNLSTF